MILITWSWWPLKKYHVQWLIGTPEHIFGGVSFQTWNTKQNDSAVVSHSDSFSVNPNPQTAISKLFKALPIDVLPFMATWFRGIVEENPDQDLSATNKSIKDWILVYFKTRYKIVFSYLKLGLSCVRNRETRRFTICYN